MREERIGSRYRDRCFRVTAMASDDREIQGIIFVRETCTEPSSPEVLLVDRYPQCVKSGFKWWMWKNSLPNITTDSGGGVELKGENITLHVDF